MHAVEVRGLTKSFGGTRALHEVTFDVAEGSLTGLVGPNGSGKSTTLRCVSGFLRQDAGVVSLFGERIERSSPQGAARRGVAQTFQRVALAEELTVAENVILASDARRLSMPRRLLLDARGFDRGTRGVDMEAVLGAIEETGLEACADEPAGSLPLGIRRRVELARAIAVRPRLLLLDEPMSGLDTGESAAMAEVVRRIHASKGATILVVEHDMEVIASLCSHLVVLDFGQVLAAGETAATLRDPAVRDAYLGTGA